MSLPELNVNDGELVTSSSEVRVGEECCCGFTCFPAADEFSPSDDTLKTYYPDVLMGVSGIDHCICFRNNPGSQWTIYTDHGFDGHSYLLVPDSFSRSGTGHSQHYSYFTNNDPSIPSVGDNQLTSAVYTGPPEEECTANDNETISDVYIVQCGLTLQCSEETAPEWTWGFDSLVIGVGAGDIFNSTLPGGGWTGAAGEITAVNNTITMGACGSGDHPGGGGQLIFTAVAPGI